MTILVKEAITDLIKVIDAGPQGIAGSDGQVILSKIIVNQANAVTILGGVIDSTKMYEIDGIVDLGITEITVPIGGMYLTGKSFDIDALISTEDNYTMFKSDPTCGNVYVSSMDISVSGANSRVYNLTNGNVGSFFIVLDVIYKNCTSLGYLNGFSTGLENNVAKVGGSPSLELDGTWVGFRCSTGSYTFLSASMTEPIFKAGATLAFTSSFFCDAGVDLSALASLIDFSSSNFIGSAVFRLVTMNITRDGVVNIDDSNVIINLDQGDPASHWFNNTGIHNTFPGGGLEILTEVLTPIAVMNTFYAIEGNWLSSDLEHFDSPVSGQLRHISYDPIDYKVSSNFVLVGNAGNVITIRLVKWDDSESTFVFLGTQTREVSNLSGPRDIAIFTMVRNVILDINDYVFFEVSNNMVNDVTLEEASSLIIGERG